MKYNYKEYEVHFRHIRDLEGARRITLCHIVNHELNEIFFEFSICSKKDQFNKKIGRKISLGRLNNDFFFIPYIRPTWFTKLNDYCVDKIIKSLTNPYYFRKGLHDLNVNRRVKLFKNSNNWVYLNKTSNNIKNY